MMLASSVCLLCYRELYCVKGFFLPMIRLIDDSNDDVVGSHSSLVSIFCHHVPSQERKLMPSGGHARTKTDRRTRMHAKYGIDEVEKSTSRPTVDRADVP